MVVLFAVLFGASQFHRSSGGVVAPELAREFAASPSALGAIASALFLSSAIAQIPIGLLLDRYGARRTLPLLLVLAIAGSAWFAASQSVSELVAARVVIGVGYGGVMMSAFAVFARWFPPDRFATVSGLMLALGGVGGLLGTTPLAGLVAVVGWRSTFYGVAGFTAVLALIALVLVRDAPPGYRSQAKPPGSLAENLIGLWQVITLPRFRYILAMGVVSFAPSMAILGLWGGPYLRDIFDLGTVARGNVLLAMAVATLVGTLTFGPLDRVFRTRKYIVLAASAFILLSLGMLGLVSRPPLWLVVALFTVIAFCQPSFIVLAAHCRATFPDHLIGRAATSLNLVSILGVAFMQWLFSLIVGAFAPGGAAAPELAYRIGFAAMAICVLLAALAYTRSTDIRPG